MPMTVSNATGDGISSDQIVCNISLPDVGTSIRIDGTVTSSGGTTASITGDPLTAPSAPGAGNIFWIIQVNKTTGVASIKQSTSSMPTADSGNELLFQQTLAANNVDIALDPTDVTPDTF